MAQVKDTSPGLFTQIFTVLGLRKRNVAGGEGVALPFVYGFPKRKMSQQCVQVLRAIREAYFNTFKSESFTKGILFTEEQN